MNAWPGSIVVAAMLTLAAGGSRAADATLDAARHAFAEARFDEARQLADHALKTRRRNASLWSLKGDLDLLDDKLADAARDFDRALAIDPADKAAQRGRGDVAARRRARDAAAALSTPVSIPFAAIDPLPVLKIRLNGRRDVWVLLDTGAPALVLDPAVAAELNAQTQAQGKGAFAGGRTADVRTAQVGSVQLGGATFHDIQADVLPMEGAPHPEGVKIEGMVGTGLLYPFVATVDYPHRRLTLERSVRRDGACANTRLWFAPSHFLFIRARVNDLTDGLFNVDTGGEGVGVQLAESQVKAAGVTLDKSKASKMAGAGGDVTVLPFDARVSIGGYSAAHTPGLVTEGGDQYSIFPFRVAGTLSHEFFKHSVTTIDFTRMRLVMGECRSAG